MIRILALGDTHARHNVFRSLPPADVFLHAGDFTRYGQGAEEFALWFHRLPYALKLLTLGNHESKDAVAQYSAYQWQSLFGPMLLTDRGVRATIRGQSLTILGLPYETRMHTVPAEVDVVLSHEPPFRILDRTHDGGLAGSERIAELVRSSDARTHIFGHVHAQGGRIQTEGYVTHANVATRALLLDLTETGVHVVSVYAP